MNGILLIDKPAGWTSNDVVQKLRGILKERRIGHAGTLDPLATGLLTVFVGRATRAVEFAEGDEKRYLAGLRLGVTTDTQDITGNILPLAKPESEAVVSEEKLSQVLQQFHGKQLQIPPMYSAVKVNGQRLYKIARCGGEIERKPREITVYEIKLSGRENTDFLLDVRCSKGTYVRTLCHEIGQALGCGACMSSLRRLESGAFSVQQAYRLEDVQNGRYSLIPVDRLFQKYPQTTVDAYQEKKIRNGQSFQMLNPSTMIREERIRLYSVTGEFLALGSVQGKLCRIIKSFFEV